MVVSRRARQDFSKYYKYLDTIIARHNAEMHIYCTSMLGYPKRVLSLSEYLKEKKFLF